MIVVGIKHAACSWAGQPFLRDHWIHVSENPITTEHSLLEALRALDDTLFLADNKGYDIFSSVVMQRFKLGHVHASHGSYHENEFMFDSTHGCLCLMELEPPCLYSMELACKCCGRYVRVYYALGCPERCSTLTELQEARATLLSFISGCQYTRPGSDDLPQR